jgi:iron complex transport system permease protein
VSKSKFIFNVLILLLILSILISVDLCFGSTNLFLIDKSNPMFSSILFDIRLPKAITAIIAGSGLALCGLLMQSLFRNPIAGPYVLGVSSGASLFVAIATMMISSIQISGFIIMGKSIVTLFSILGALFVTLVVLLVSKKNKSNITVLLVGLMLGQILSAFQGLIEYMSNADNLKTFVIWGMGSVGSTTMEDLFFVIPIYILAVVASFFIIKPLNAILLNEQYAQNLGVNVNALRLSVIIISAVLVGVITAFCGPIAFVGISVPIASRLFFKTAHHLHQIVFCLLLGACVVLFSDVICQLLSSHFMLPINTVTTLIGSPIVIYLLFKSKLNIG